MKIMIFNKLFIGFAEFSMCQWVDKVFDAIRIADDHPEYIVGIHDNRW